MRLKTSYNPPVISLKLPTGDAGPTADGQVPARIDASNTLSEYKVDITKDADGGQNAKNTFVFMEKERVWGGVGAAAGAGGGNVGAGGIVGKRKREKGASSVDCIGWELAGADLQPSRDCWARSRTTPTSRRNIMQSTTRSCGGEKSKRDNRRSALSV